MATIETTPIVNPYLLSLISPFDAPPAPIPDDNMQPAIVKSVTIGQTVTVGDPAGEVFVFQPYAPQEYQLRQYKACVARGGALEYYRTLKSDQDLYQNYTKYRVISAGLTIKSSTISAGNFDVAGNITGVCVQALPDLDTVLVDQLVPYRYTDADYALMISAQDGLVCVAPPGENHEFIDFDVTVGGPSPYTGLRSSDPVESVYSNALVDPVNWHQPALVGVNLWSVFECVKPTYRMDSWTGLMHLRANLQVVILGPAGSMQDFFIQYQHTWANNDGTANVAWEACSHQGFTVPGGLPPGQYENVCLEAWLAPQDAVTGFRICCSASAAVMQVGSVGTRAADNFFLAENLVVRKHGFQGPAFIIACRGLDVGNQITISGVVNYEVVPTAALARDLKINHGGEMDTGALARAELVMHNKAELGLKTVYSTTQWNMSAEVRSRVVSAEAMSVGHAAGKDVLLFIKKFLGRLAPFMPAIGTGLGTAFGNPMIGRSLGTLAQQLTKGFTAQASGNVPVAHCSGTEDPSKMEAFMKTMMQRMDQLEQANKILREENVQLRSTATVATAALSSTTLRPDYQKLFYGEQHPTGGGTIPTKGLHAARQAFYRGGAPEKSVYSNQVGVADFPIIHEGTAYVARVVVSMEPLSREGANIRYMDTGRYQIDAMITSDAVMNSARALDSVGIPWKYVSLYDSGKFLVDGPSIYLAVVAAALQWPAFALFSGSPTATMSDGEIQLKKTLVASGHRTLVIVMLDAQPQLLSSYLYNYPNVIILPTVEGCLAYALRFPELHSEIEVKGPIAAKMAAYNPEAMKMTRAEYYRSIQPPKEVVKGKTVEQMQSQTAILSMAAQQYPYLRMAQPAEVQQFLTLNNGAVAQDSARLFAERMKANLPLKASRALSALIMQGGMPALNLALKLGIVGAPAKGAPTSKKTKGATQIPLRLTPALTSFVEEEVPPLEGGMGGEEPVTTTTTTAVKAGDL